MAITWKQSLAIFAAILLVGGFLRLYKLDNQSFIADEYIGVNIGYGVHQTGEWKFWDFKDDRQTDESYTRAVLYHWQVAKIFDFLPANEFNARLASVLWGLVGIILVYLVSFLLLRNHWIALISAFLLVVSVSALMFDRKVRMYSMFAPVYLLLVFLVYKFFESRPVKGPEWVINLSRKTDLNWNFFLPTFLVGLVSLETHLLTVNIIPTFVAFCIIRAIWRYHSDGRWKNRYVLVSLLSVVGLFLLYLIPQMRSSIDLGSFNWGYWGEVMLDYSYGPLAALVMVAGMAELIRIDRKKGLWLSLAFIIPLLFAIFVWNRNVGPQYIYFTESFKVIIMAAGIWSIIQFFSNNLSGKYKKLVFGGGLLIALAILVNISFFFSRSGFYQDIKKWSYPNYRQAFKYYLDHRQEDDLLITRQLTYFYLWNTQVPTLVYNETDRLTVEDIQQAQQQYPGIWFIVGNDNYIKGSAMDYIEQTFQPVETNYTNDTIKIWQWNGK